MRQDFYKKYMTVYRMLLGICFLGVFTALFFGDRRWAVLLLLLVTAGIIGLHMYIVQHTAREFWVLLQKQRLWMNGKIQGMYGEPHLLRPTARQ